MRLDYLLEREERRSDLFRQLVRLAKMEVAHGNDPFYERRLSKMADAVISVILPAMEEWVRDAREGDPYGDWVIGPNEDVVNALIGASNFREKMEAITMSLNALHVNGRIASDYFPSPTLSQQDLNYLSNIGGSFEGID